MEFSICQLWQLLVQIGNYVNKQAICHDEKTSLNGTFEWKIESEEDDDSYVVSQPDVCWHNDSIVLRKCNFEIGKWHPLQVQCKKYQSRNVKCPDDLLELRVNKDYLCLKISPNKEAFDEHSCYGSNLVIGSNRDERDNEILKFLLKKLKITSFWMPIKREKENEFNPFVIKLPGKQWKDLFDLNEWHVPESIQILSSKHCIAAVLKEDMDTSTPNLVKMEIKTVECNNLHYSVCIIENHLAANSGCPRDFGALSHRPNECFGIAWEGQQYPEDFRMLNVIEYFRKINTINIIFEELDIINDKFVEVEGIISIPNKKWTIKPKSNELKIVSSTKKIHGLCVKYIESRKHVQMLLRFDSDLDTLILTAYNKFYIWSNSKPENSIACFTNAGYEQLLRVKLKKIWENESETKTIFKLKIKSDYPGQYWCEAHTIFNFTHVMSSKVIAAKATTTGHTFAMQIEVSATQFVLPFNFAPDQMKDIATSIKNDMKNIRKDHKQLNDLIIHNVRIMDILYRNATHMQCICHTTVSAKHSSLSHSNERNDEEDEEEREDPQSPVLQMKAKYLLANLMQKLQPRFANTVLSTEFCFPEEEWELARIGQHAVKSKLCLQANGLPLTRKCLGDFIRGAYWENKSIENCTTEANLLTSHLYSIERQYVLQEQMENTIRSIRELLEYNLENIIPADLYYLASIMSNSIRQHFKAAAQPLQRSDKFVNYTIQQSWSFVNYSETSMEIVRILNFVLQSNEQVIRNSVVLNSTNILLDAFEYLIDHTSLRETHLEEITSPLLEIQVNDENEIDVIEYLDVGVVIKIATNFLVCVIDPQVANISGIALFQADLNNSRESYDEGSLKGAFKNEYYRFISLNQSVEDLLNAKNLVMGTYVPNSLWQRLDEISILANSTWPVERPEPKIIIKVYANDKLFQETNPSSDLIKDKIISISIPGHGKDLPEVMPLILTISGEMINTFGNNSEFQSPKSFCGYWNYQTWANDGVMIINRSELSNNTVLCGITHLTPFAYLIGGSYNLSVDSDIEYVVKEIHKQALDIITLIGCSLSLFGIFGLFVTACTFRSWRRKANSKVLLQLSAAIAFQMILFCFVNTEDNSNHLISNRIYHSCIAIGASLHYSVLVQFCWMIIIAYLQFKRYVQVFGNTRPTRFFIKSAILGWGLPVIPVACVLLFDSTSYIPQPGKSANPLCYPNGISFYTGIVFPITVVIIANLIIFIIVIYHLLKNPSGAIRHTEKSLALSQIRVLVLLFFLLGFTWIFGLLNIMKTALIFSYLFCLTATLQGFILFLYFVVMDPLTRRLWCGYFAKICGLRLHEETSSSVKETTQSLQ